MKTFDLTGFVGMDITPDSVATLLKEANGEDITINLASVGGYVYDGFHIFNQFKDYPGRKTLVINGITASMAAYISTAFDHVVVKDNSSFMIHNTQGGALGDYRALEKEARELKRLNSVIGTAYAHRTRQPMHIVLGMMDEETWMYGKEIVDAGFADELVDTSSQSDRAAVLKAAREKVAAFRPPIRPDDISRAAALIVEDEATGMIEQIDKNNSAVGGKNKLGGTSVKDEVFEKLKVMVTNAQVTLPEIAGALGLSHLVVTDEHREAVKIRNDLKALLGVEDIIPAITGMKKELDSGRETVRTARLNSLFGKQDAEHKNRLRYYMDNQTTGLFGQALEDKIDAVKKNDPLAKQFMAERADMTSGENTLGVVDHREAAGQTQPANASDKRRVVEM